MFTVDKEGGMYVFIQNNNGVWIRCESQGADIAAAFESVESEGLREETTTETESTPTTASSETLRPLQAVQSGAYGCLHSYEMTYWASTDDPSYYEDDDPDIFSVLLFEDGTTLTLQKNSKLISQYPEGTYVFDPATGKVNFQGGNLAA
jgi:hypothetical protein